jgi:hypothetical protein
LIALGSTGVRHYAIADVAAVSKGTPHRWSGLSESESTCVRPCIYVARYTNPGAAITVYNKGLRSDVPPVADITGVLTGLSSSAGVALDGAGNIYAFLITR